MTDSRELKECKRILILGRCGTGKSTFARMLGERLNLDVIHLDKHFHKPNWVGRDFHEFAEIVRQLTLKEQWIMDGNYTRTLSIRLPRADFIFVFDYPSYFCVYRILKRNLKTRLGFEKRFDLADGCNEQWFDWEFVKHTWNFGKNYMPKAYAALSEMNFDKNKLLIFRNYREFKKYHKNLERTLH